MQNVFGDFLFSVDIPVQGMSPYIDRLLSGIANLHAGDIRTLQVHSKFRENSFYVWRFMQKNCSDSFTISRVAVPIIKDDMATYEVNHLQHEPFEYYVIVEAVSQ